jgi:hypothetical protein
VIPRIPTYLLPELVVRQRQKTSLLILAKMDMSKSRQTGVLTSPR